MTERTPIFDGHNDVLFRLWQKRGRDPVRAFLDGDGEGHLDLPRMKAAGFAGGFFAIFAPSPSDGEPEDEDAINHPLAASVPADQALPVTLGMAALLLRIEAASEGGLKICHSASDVRGCMISGSMAAIMHVEGCEFLDPDFYALDVLYAAGLRSLGPVWSRSNIFGHGVPFRFPSSPDTGDGLTPLGQRLVRACREKRILVDMSHLNEKGFWDAAALGGGPLVATHSNAHALSASSRNLTDAQLKAVGETGGMAGLNFANGFLRADGAWKSENGLDTLLRHLDHMMKHAGEDHVGLGSDFDGARIPAMIGDVRGLTNLVAAMRAHGYGEKLIAKLTHENWIACLERVLGG